MDPAGTEPPSARRRIGFSEIPRKVRGIVFANVLGAVGFGYLFVFIAAYLPQIGIGAEVVGLLFGAQGVAIVLSAIPLGIYSDRGGPSRSRGGSRPGCGDRAERDPPRDLRVPPRS